ncbi:MAG: hypothetical protein ABWZ54_05620 [Luteibacter sp.]
MAGKTIQRWIFAAIASISIGTAIAASNAPLRYDIALSMHHDILDHLEMSATTRTDEHGLADFTIPWPGSIDISAEHGELDTATDGHWKIRAAAGTEVVLHWRSPAADRSHALAWNSWQRVLVRSDLIAASNRAFFALPDGTTDRDVEVHWTAPPGWTVSTSLVQGMQRVDDIVEGGFLAAARATHATRKVGSVGQLRVTAVGALASKAGPIASMLADMLNHALPAGGAGRDYTVNLIDMEAPARASSVTSWRNAAMVYAATDASVAPWLFTTAGRAADPGIDPSDYAEAWYLQGFAAYRLAAAARATPWLSPAEMAVHFDRLTSDYGNSPLRRAPNEQVVREYDKIREMAALPRLRGELFAWLLDGRIRAATAGRSSLDDALDRMDVRPADPGEALVRAVAAVGGGDIAPLYRRYIVDGELLVLPGDALGPEYSIGTVEYDYGWRLQRVFAR